MKRYPLQLVTVHLENGEEGVFIGLPLIGPDNEGADNPVDNLWFSDVQEVSAELTLTQLLSLVRNAVCVPSSRLN